MAFSSFDPIVPFPISEPRAAREAGAFSPLADHRQFDQHLRQSSRPASKDGQAAGVSQVNRDDKLDQPDRADPAPARDAARPSDNANSSDESSDAERTGNVSPEDTSAEDQESGVIDVNSNPDVITLDIPAATSEIADAHDDPDQRALQADEAVVNRQSAAELPAPLDTTSEQHPENTTSEQHLKNTPAEQHPGDTPVTQHPENTPAEQHPENTPATQRPGDTPAEQRPGDTPAEQRPEDTNTSEHARTPGRAVSETDRTSQPLETPEVVKPSSNDRPEANARQTIGKPHVQGKHGPDGDQDATGDEQGGHRQPSWRAESKGLLAAVPEVLPVHRRTQSDQSVADAAGQKRAASQPRSTEAVESKPSGAEGSQDGKSTIVSPRPVTQTVAKGAEQTADRSALSGPDQARFIQRVTRAAEVAHNRGGPIRLRLSPPELGSLRLEVRVSDGVLTARIEVETETTRNALLENVPALRERLANQGIRVEQFDVNLMDRQTGSAPDGSYDQQEQTSNSAGRPKPDPRDNVTANHNEPIVLRVLDNDAQLDVII